MMVTDAATSLLIHAGMRHSVLSGLNNREVKHTGMMWLPHNLYRLPEPRMKRIPDPNLKSRTAGIVSLVPRARARRTWPSGLASPPASVA